MENRTMNIPSAFIHSIYDLFLKVAAYICISLKLKIKIVFSKIVTQEVIHQLFVTKYCKCPTHRAASIF